jgi:N-dimethylarginine dimethylaminohydrolase
MRTRTDAPRIEALAWFHDHGLEPDQPTEHQFKFGDVTFYPRTVFVDGKICRRDETGLEALAAVLRELGYLDDLPDKL